VGPAFTGADSVRASDWTDISHGGWTPTQMPRSLPKSFKAPIGWKLTAQKRASPVTRITQSYASVWPIMLMSPDIKPCW